MRVSVVNLEQGMPYVEEALKRMDYGLRTARTGGADVVKLIHGYGSSGTGGRIKTAVLRALADKKRRGEIREYVTGEEFSPFYENCRRAMDHLPGLQHDRDYLRCNQGITIVLLK